MRYNSNRLKMKTTWSLYRKIDFKLLINNHLGPAWRTNISEVFGYLFFSAFCPQANISTPSTLVFLLLQKFEFTLHFRYCCIIRAWSSNFNPSSYLQLWTGCIHQNYAAVTHFKEELIGLFSVGEQVVIALRAFQKKCPMDSFARVVLTAQYQNHSPSVTKDIEICHQLQMTVLSSHTSTCAFVQWSPLQKLW